MGIAQIYRLQRELKQALIEFRTAYDVSSSAGNVTGAAWAIRGQAEIAKENGDTLLAIQLALEARAQFSAIGYKLGAAYALKTQVEALLSEGRITESLSIARQCRDEFEVCGERRGVGFSLLTLGTICARFGEPFQAIPLLQQSQILLASSGGSEHNGFSPTVELRRIFARLGNVIK